jgi:hypothetical protein
MKFGLCKKRYLCIAKRKTAKLRNFTEFYDFAKPQKYLSFISFTIMIIREQYINRLKNMLGIKVIKVITGLRRVGKTTLFQNIC